MNTYSVFVNNTFCSHPITTLITLIIQSFLTQYYHRSFLHSWNCWSRSLHRWLWYCYPTNLINDKLESWQIRTSALAHIAFLLESPSETTSEASPLASSSSTDSLTVCYILTVKTAIIHTMHYWPPGSHSVGLNYFYIFLSSPTDSFFVTALHS